MKEDCHYLDQNGERVFAVFHEPATRPSRAVVMCHPLGEEKLWAHRVFVSLARDLCRHGIVVARFDFRGEGDSDRSFEDSDLATRIEDTALAVQRLRAVHDTINDITLLGLRFGTIVAASTASRLGDVARLVLWDPVVDGAAYMQSVLRLNLMFQMALHRKVVATREELVARLASGETVNIEGYQLAQSLYEQTSKFSLHDELKGFSGDCLLVQINPTDAPPRPDLQSLAKTIPSCQLDLVTEEPFWREIKSFYGHAAELTRVTRQALDLTE